MCSAGKSVLEAANDYLPIPANSLRFTYSAPPTFCISSQLSKLVSLRMNSSQGSPGIVLRPSAVKTVPSSFGKAVEATDG